MCGGKVSDKRKKPTQPRQLQKRRFVVEPKYKAPERVLKHIKLKSLIMAQIERWRYA